MSVGSVTRSSMAESGLSKCGKDLSIQKGRQIRRACAVIPVELSSTFLETSASKC